MVSGGRMFKVSKKTEKSLKDILQKHTEKEGNIISLLQDIQDVFGYIPSEVVDWFSEKLEIPESRFFGVITFYAQFYLKPRGKNVITACCGTACHVKGSDRLIDNLARELKIPESEDTTEDGQFTLERVACVGACSIAPVVIVNKKVHAKATMSRLKRVLKDKA
jgi:NADH:ubiquinone oxidoreductase subunit E